MMERRMLMKGLPGLAVAAALPVRAQAAPAKSGMKHRSYSGTVSYIADDREIGRETFTTTIQPDGLRTMRVQCEMDEDRLLRDVVITVDKDWMPLHAFVQLTVQEQFMGATWYHFTPTEASADGFTTADGRVSQRFPLTKRVESFVAHPIHQDSWHLARIRKGGGAAGTPEFSSSLLPNGGSGPTLVPFPKDYLRFSMVGQERITVPAGSFTADHFQITVVPKNKVMNIWAFGEDCIPLRLDTGARRYDLVTLSGDPR